MTSDHEKLWPVGSFLMEACRFGQKEKEKVKKLFKQNENYFELSDPVKDIAYNSVRVTKAAFRSFYVSSYVCVALGKKKQQKQQKQVFSILFLESHNRTNYQKQHKILAK